MFHEFTNKDHPASIPFHFTDIKPKVNLREIPISGPPHSQYSRAFKPEPHETAHRLPLKQVQFKPGREPRHQFRRIHCIARNNQVPPMCCQKYSAHATVYQPTDTLTGMSRPHLTPIHWNPDIPETKFASRIRSKPDGCQIALIGLPDDTGVSLNNGRPGAKDGPSAFRASLAAMGVANPADWSWPTIFDAGDVEVIPGDLHATHDRITEAVESLLELNLFPIAIGGGHDLTFPFVRAVANKFGPMNGVYFDPHLDVRETDGSGMPFRRLIETKAANALRIHGFDTMSNSVEHVEWFQAHGGRIDTTTLPSDPWPKVDTFVSLDLDVFDASYAPGVSAMNPAGATPADIARWVHSAGANPDVRCFDIMELSPPHDQSNRTARLAARMFLTFLQGFSERSS